MEAIPGDTLRIIDANLNRIGEGLRVLEELARLMLNDAILTQQLKNMRHDLVRHDWQMQQQLLQARDSEGDVERVDMKKLKIHIENITIEKVDGTAISLPIHPSNVMITKLKIDKVRQDVIDRIVAARSELEGKED